jgi:WD40 repeat protein/serine/threonine protein kinase
MNQTDRHLLFGILALQMNFVGRDALLAAMHAWVLERSKPLGRILVEQQGLSLARHDLLERLVDEHLAAHGGDAEKSLAATDGLGALRVDLERGADPEILATLERVPGATAATLLAPQDTLTFSEHSPVAGSRFSILRPHARGGLGQISVAVDRELNREVALKELRPERADDLDSRARFLLEAEVTGRLEHPGVVPVYALGWNARGQPFYAMRLVKGETLKEAIEHFHARQDAVGGDVRPWNLALRQLLNRFVAVCNVIAYAHSRGVIHRDLKPANILLGPYGETLVVDWGLAKVVGRGEGAAHAGAVQVTFQPASGSSETLPGTALGTPAYMSPEQAEGRLDQVGPLSDVYSLGATLFCLLTGKPPVGETDVGEVLRRVQRGEFPPPRAVRPGIPQGLEAIVLKALALKPEGRYPAARVLADEIEDWLADEPVSVYREPITVRLTRWGRRHRTLATSIGVLLITTVVGLAIAAALIRREQRQTEGERLRAEISLVEANRQRKIAEDNALDAHRRAEELRRKNYIGNVNLAISECLGNNVTRALEFLDGCPGDLRGWEWDFVWRQCHLDLGTFRQSGQALNGVAFNPDGTRVASVSGAFSLDEPAKKGDLVVRDVGTGQEIYAHRDVASGFRGVAFSPDSRWIATGNAMDLVILDAATGKEEFRLTDPGNRDDPVLSLAFSPDSRRIIAGYGEFNRAQGVGRANLWDLTNRKLIERIPEDRGVVYCVAFSPDGREVALASEGLVELCDVETPTGPIRAFRSHIDLVYAVAFSPDGLYLASGGLDRAVRLWDRATGKEIRAFFGHEGFVRGLAFSPDGRWILSASEDHSVKLWEIASGRSLADFHGHRSFASCVAYSPDGRLAASGGQDHAVKLWFATRRAPLTFTGHDGAVRGLQFLPESQRLVSGSGNFSTRGRLKVWDATTGEPLEPSFESCPEVYAVALHRNGRRLATACFDRIAGVGTVRVWDLDTGRLVWEREPQAAWVADVAYSPDGKWLASAGVDEQELGGEVRLWDAEAGREIGRFEKHTAGVFGVAFSPDSRWLASGWGDGMVRIRDAKAPAGEARELPGHAGGVERVAFLPDGRLASAGGRAEAGGHSVHAAAQRGRPGLASAGGRAEAGGTSGFGEVKIWDLSTGRVLDLRGHTGLVEGLAYTRDGRRMATASDDRTIKLWDTTTGEEVFTLRGHTAGVLCVAFSPDGRRIASGGWDRTVRVWDTSPPASHAPFQRGAESRVGHAELPADPFAR